MKQLILIAAIIIGFISCTPPADKNKKENLLIAEKYMEAIETGNVAIMDSLLADDYKGYGPSINDSTNKVDAIKNWKYNVENLYESIKYSRHKELAVTVSDGIGQGDWVLNWAILTIKYKDGRGPVSLYVNVIYRVENGKIVHSITFYDEADVMRQLGYKMIPAAAE